MIDQEAEGPDDKRMWTINGTYVTEEDSKEQFTASVTSRGEVVMIKPPSHRISEKHPSKLSR